MSLKNSYQYFIPWLFCLFLFHCAPSHHYLKDVPVAIEEMVQKKVRALKEKDATLYMSLIDKNNSEYYIEQYRWFYSYKRSDIENFRIKIVGVEKKEDDTYLVTLKQTYRYGKSRRIKSVTYDELYKRDKGSYYDSGQAFAIHETKHFTIKYDERLKAHISFLGRQAERAYRSATRVIDRTPESRTTVKFYYGRKACDESIGVARYFPTGGWHGAGESLKICVNKGRRMRYDWVIAHELIHKIAFEISHSICRWFNEGIARVYGDRPLLRLESVGDKGVGKSLLEKDMAWLEESSPLKMTDKNKINLYYAMSEKVVNFILDTFGEDAIHKILKAYAEREASDATDQKQDENDLFYEILNSVFKMSREEFNKKYIEWIFQEEKR